jgi:crossover junction endodeoxyribonuclease RuvC
MSLNNPKNLKILGIDPGIADTGYGLVTVCGSKITHIDHGSIVTNKNLSLSARLVILEKELTEIIAKHQPDIAGVEDLFFSNNAKTAMAVSQARGVVLLTLEKHHLTIKEFTPPQVKQGITGYGKADKKQIQQMTKTILGLPEIPKPDDAADALAIAICSANNHSY